MLDVHFLAVSRALTVYAVSAMAETIRRYSLCSFFFPISIVFIPFRFEVMLCVCLFAFSQPAYDLVLIDVVRQRENQFRFLHASPLISFSLCHNNNTPKKNNNIYMYFCMWRYIFWCFYFSDSHSHQ